MAQHVLAKILHSTRLCFRRFSALISDHPETGPHQGGKRGGSPRDESIETALNRLLRSVIVELDSELSVVGNLERGSRLRSNDLEEKR